ncbi:hypothetical protein QZH41_016314 [Actinostola sp. cb2023]|nr:hypothetical protein QZH41_016314 [Actinostola sp. cb2023]
MQVAIKEIPKGRLKHPNVIMLIGWVVTDTDVLVVMNYVKGTNLAYAIGLTKSKRSIEILDAKYNGFVMYNTAQGMVYLHAKHIIHQDLKPGNILVEDLTKKAIICDFGISKLRENATMATTVSDKCNGGTLAYQHIEQLQGKVLTYTVDVYAFAVVMAEVHSRKRAWDGKGATEVRNSILDGKYPQFPDITGPCAALIDRCFQQPSDRPSFSEMLPKYKNYVRWTFGNFYNYM